MISYVQIEGLSKRYGENILFENISFGINKDQKIALIAKNGSGKTSLLNIIAQHDSADEGSVTFRGDISFGYLQQDPYFDENNTVLEQALHGSGEVIIAVKEYHAAIHSNNKNTIQKAMERMDALEAWDFDVRIKQILDKLALSEFDKLVKELSGGQRKRLALANVLINEPDLLFLDEPTNHLDLEMIEWLENYLDKTKSTLFMVTHDRYFLDRVCNEIIEMEGNSIHKYRGNYAYFLEKRAERIISTNTTIEKANKLLKNELDWMNRMPQARGTKAKYRVENFYKIKEVASQNTQEDKIRLDVKTTRLGKKVLDIYSIYKQFGDKVLIADFNHKFIKNEKIGIVGKNGSGKSTLLNILMGNVAADQGKIDAGETVVFGYYKQEGIKLEEDKRVIEVVKDVAEVINLGDGRKLSASQFLEFFLFPAKTQYNYVSKLSGGERRRLYLLTVLMKNPNFLILDEPTNDLDIVTLNVLEEYLQNFDGCVLIVSHDRYFMDKVVDNLFVFEDNGKIKHFPGNYSRYHEYKEEQEREIKKTAKPAKPDARKNNSQEKPKRKFSYKEKTEYEQIEKDIELLELEKTELENEMNSGKLAPETLIMKSERYGEILNLLEEKEMRWLELNELIEGE